MKNSVVFLAAMAVSPAAMAQDASPAPTEAAIAPAAPAPAAATEPLPGKIVMYRPGAIMGMGVACPIRYKGVELVELGRNKFAEWTVKPGRYILTNKTASVEVTVDPGESRYVRCQIKTGFMTGRADLQIVDAESFAAKAAEFERKEVVVPQ